MDRDTDDVAANPGAVEATCSREHLNIRRGHEVTAMRCGDDMVGTDQRPAAELCVEIVADVFIQQCNLKWVVAGGCVGTTDDPRVEDRIDSLGVSFFDKKREFCSLFRRCT